MMEHLTAIHLYRAPNGTYTALVPLVGHTRTVEGFATIDTLLACCGELIAQDLRQRKTLELPKVEL